VKLGADLPKRWIILKAALFVAIAALCVFLLLATEDWRQEAVLAVILMWASARLYYFCFYVITQYLDPTFQFTGIVSALRWLIGKRK